MYLYSVHTQGIQFYYFFFLTMDQFLLFLILKTNTIFTLNKKNSSFHNFFIIDIHLKNQ